MIPNKIVANLNNPTCHHHRFKSFKNELLFLLIISLRRACRSAGGLQKMSNFNVLARLAPLGSLAPARRPHPPRLRNRRLGKRFCKAKSPRKNAKILKNFDSKYIL